LEIVRKDLPTWKIPQIEVVVRKSGEMDFDDEIEEACDSEGEELEKDVEELEREGEDSDEDEDDDSTFYEELKRMMLYEVPKEDIKRLKRGYHPRRMYGYAEAKRLNKQPGSYITDSESESDDSHDSDLEPWYVRD
jgi:hypothetical protein